MSTEEDTELRDLVAQTLEINGCLPKIRAELRASIFLALDEDAELQKQEPLLNKKVKTQLESQDGQTMFCLVREFLEFFDLDFTISVYEPESYLGAGYHYEGRSKIIENLGISQLKENPTLPLLLQLIQIARLKNVSQNKNLDINLTQIQNEGCTTEEEPTSNSTDNEDSTKIKTDEVRRAKDKSATSISENLNHSNHSHSNDNSINGVLNPITEIHAVVKEANLNETFDISSPTSINLIKESKKAEKQEDEKPKPSIDIILNPPLIESSKSGSDEKDDTYDGTSSIAEDSVKDSPQLDLDKITQNSEKSSETEFSPPILKDSKSHSKFDMSFDKLKLSPQKTEKLKAKSSLSSLADLPPLQLNKSRNDTVLLPSLYSREFKEKTANQTLRELDKFFYVDVDSLDNYEEDFMSESEINLNSSRNNLLDELQSSSITDSNKNVSIKSAESKNSCSRKGFLQNEKKSDSINKEKSADTNQNLEKNKTDVRGPKNSNSFHTRDNSGTSSVASDEINSNIDDILNSPTSN